MLAGDTGTVQLQFVHKLLTRVSYLGTHHFNRRDSRTGKPKARDQWVAVEVPRVIEDDIFQAVQAQLSARNPKMTAPRITHSEILLTGMARCGWRPREDSNLLPTV